MGRVFKYLGSKESVRELWENREALDKYLARLKELMEGGDTFGENSIMANEFPRRAKLYEMSPAEKAIWDATQEVEKLPADVRLTEAVILLAQAREKVADYIDGI